MQHRRGETVIDLTMSVVLPIVGGIIGTLTLRHVTALPFWALRQNSWVENGLIPGALPQTPGFCRHSSVSNG
jgi:hypothetical protein